MAGGDELALKVFGAALVVLVLVLVGYYIYKNFPSVRDIVGGVGNIGKEVVGGVVDVVKKPVMAVVAPVVGAVGGAARGVASVLPAPVRALIPRSVSDVTSLPGRVAANPLGAARAVIEATPAAVTFRQIQSRVPLPTPRLPTRIIPRPVSNALGRVIPAPISGGLSSAAGAIRSVIPPIPAPRIPKLW